VEEDQTTDEENEDVDMEDNASTLSGSTLLGSEPDSLPAITTDLVNRLSGSMPPVPPNTPDRISLPALESRAFHDGFDRDEDGHLLSQVMRPNVVPSPEAAALRQAQCGSRLRRCYTIPLDDFREAAGLDRVQVGGAE